MCYFILIKAPWDKHIIISILYRSRVVWVKGIAPGHSPKKQNQDEKLDFLNCYGLIKNVSQRPHVLRGWTFGKELDRKGMISDLPLGCRVCSKKPDHLGDDLEGALSLPLFSHSAPPFSLREFLQSLLSDPHAIAIVRLFTAISIYSVIFTFCLESGSCTVTVSPNKSLL